MKVVQHVYTEALFEAAEQFLIGQFEAPTQFTEAPHLPDLVDAAMHIVTGAAWIQPDASRGSLPEVPFGEREDEDEDEDEED